MSLLLLFPTATPSITLIQHSTGSTFGTGSVAEAFASPNTAGNLIILGIVVESNTDTIASVTDTNGNTYQIAGIQQGGSGGLGGYQIAIYYAKNIAAGSNTVTVTMTTGTTVVDLAIHEYGVPDPTATTLDVTASAGGLGTTVDSGSQTTLNDNELIFGLFASNQAVTLDGSLTPRATFTHNFFSYTADKIGATAGSYNVAGTLGASNRWIAAMATISMDPIPLAVLDVTLGTLSLSAAGTVDVSGTLAQTLDVIGVVSTGTVEFAGTSGVFDQTLGALTLTSTGTVDVVGTLSQTLGAVTMASAGTVDVVGTSAVTLGAVSIAATGTVDVQGLLTVTLADLALTSTGTVDIAGTLSQTLGALAVQADGIVGNPPNEGVFAVTLGAFTVSSAGLVTNPELAGALAVTLGTLALTSTGTVEVSGTAALTFSDITSTATGSVVVGGVLSTTLGDLALTATGGVEIQGVLAVTLGAVTVEPQSLWQPVARHGHGYRTSGGGTRTSSVLRPSVTDTELVEV